MITINRRVSALLALAALPTTLLCAPSSGWATAISLGSASDFAVLAGSTITNVGSTVVTGQVGLSPGTSVTGFATSDGGPGAVVGGAIHVNDSMANNAKSDFNLAWGTLSGLTGTTLTGNLGVGSNATLTAGVYNFSSTAELDGALTLDGGGDPNAQFIFLIGSSLTTASNSSVLLTDGTFFNNVYWFTTFATTLGSDTAFAGSILAGSSITLDDGASIVCGRALAETAVTISGTSQISTDCRQSTSGGPGGGTGVPEPASLALLGLGFFGLVGMVLGRRQNTNPIASIHTQCA